MLNTGNKHDKDSDKRKKRRRRRKKKTDNDEKTIENNEDNFIKNAVPSENKNVEELMAKNDSVQKINDNKNDSEQNKTQKRREWRGKSKWRRRPRSEKLDKQDESQSKERFPSAENINEKNEIKKNISGLFAAIQKSTNAIRNSVVDKNKKTEEFDGNQIEKDSSIKKKEMLKERGLERREENNIAKRGWWNKKE